MDMEQKKDILDELETLSPLLNSISREPVFRVPEGYFTDLPESLAAAMTDKAELPVWLEEPLPPAGKVPARYFEQLPGKMLETVRNQSQQAPVISIFRRFRYVAAAMLAGLFALGVWRFQALYEKSDSIASTEKELSTIFKQVSDEELTKYINLHPGTAPSGDNLMATAGPNAMNEDDVRAMLEDYSEEELENFLQHDDVSPSILN